jgi:uncharacterized membrane protein YphA (DoxX/SURF4 family)
MNVLLKLTSGHAAAARILDRFRSAALLATRLYIGWALWQSGNALLLLCTALLVPGLFTRVGAIAALVAIAVFDPTPLWSFMLLVLTVSGAGTFSLDTWLEKRLARRCRPFMAAPPA